MLQAQCLPAHPRPPLPQTVCPHCRKAKEASRTCSWVCVHALELGARLYWPPLWSAMSELHCRRCHHTPGFGRARVPCTAAGITPQLVPGCPASRSASRYGNCWRLLPALQVLASTGVGPPQLEVVDLDTRQVSFSSRSATVAGLLSLRLPQLLAVAALGRWAGFVLRHAG